MSECLIFFQRLADILSWFSSNETAWQQTLGVKGLARIPPPNDDTSWATTATKNATSWFHVDANGLGTEVTNVCGEKYWVLCNRRYDLPDSNPLGNMSSIACLPEDHDPWSSFSEVFEHEGILLKPGSIL